MGYYSRMQNRKRSEATEQEIVINWCEYNSPRHPELKLIYHVPNGGSRNQLEAANLKRRGWQQLRVIAWMPLPEKYKEGE